jgi:hypothetical protein
MGLLLPMMTSMGHRWTALVEDAGAMQCGPKAESLSTVVSVGAAVEPAYGHLNESHDEPFGSRRWEQDVAISEPHGRVRGGLGGIGGVGSDLGAGCRLEIFWVEGSKGPPSRSR